MMEKYCLLLLPLFLKPVFGDLSGKTCDFQESSQGKALKIDIPWQVFQKLLYIKHVVYPTGKKITLRECGEENRCFHSDTDHSDDSCRDVVENPLGPLIECRYVRKRILVALHVAVYCTMYMFCTGLLFHI